MGRGGVITSLEMDTTGAGGLQIADQGFACEPVALGGSF